HIDHAGNIRGGATFLRGDLRRIPHLLRLAQTRRPRPLAGRRSPPLPHRSERRRHLLPRRPLRHTLAALEQLEGTFPSPGVADGEERFSNAYSSSLRLVVIHFVRRRTG